MPHNFSNTRTKSDNFGDGAISPVRNTPRVLTTKIFTQVVYYSIILSYYHIKTIVRVW